LPAAIKVIREIRVICEICGLNRRRSYGSRFIPHKKIQFNGVAAVKTTHQAPLAGFSDNCWKEGKISGVSVQVSAIKKFRD
jgi:hypothetical protein